MLENVMLTPQTKDNRQNNEIPIIFQTLPFDSPIISCSQFIFSDQKKKFVQQDSILSTQLQPQITYYNQSYQHRIHSTGKTIKISDPFVTVMVGINDLLSIPCYNIKQRKDVHWPVQRKFQHLATVHPLRPSHQEQILSKSLRYREGLLQKCGNIIEKKERKFTSFHKDPKNLGQQSVIHCRKQKVRSLLKQCSEIAIIHKTKQVKNQAIVQESIVQQQKSSTKHSKISNSTNCSIEIQKIQRKRKEYKVLHFASKIEVFQFIKFIDSGSFGEVYLVRHLITNMVFCLKSLKKSQLNEESLQLLIRQIKIQSYLNHPNIIKVYGYASDSENVYILMEPCLGKNLYHYIQRQLMPEEKVKNYVQQLSSALAYLHKNNIIHRDVKPQNVLVDGDLVKLCDFGWAIHSPLMRGTRCGTPLYTPPEMIKQEMYDSKVDVWCLGVLTYQLLYGTIPFEIRSLSDISKIISDQICYPKSFNISAEAIDFLKGCLQKHSQSRFSIQKVIDHQFFLTKKHLYRQTFP